MRHLSAAACSLVLLTALGACSAVRVGKPLPAATSVPAPPALPLEEAWSYDAEAAFGPSPVVVRGGVLVFGTKQGELHALRAGAERAEPMGRVELGEAIEGRPATDGARVFVPVAVGRNGVKAYDLVRGETLWTRRYGPHLAGLVLDDASETLVAASHDGILRGLDPDTGDERWRFRPDSAFGAPIGGRHYRATPALLAGGRVAAVDDKGSLAVLDVQTGRLIWTREIGAPVVADLAATPERLLVPTTDGRLLAFDAQGEMAWHYAAAPLVKLTAAGVGAGIVVVGGTDGVLRALDPETGRVRWTFATDGALTAAPAVSGGPDPVVFVGSMDQRVVGLQADTGRMVWEAEVDGRIKTTPVVLPDGVVFFREPSEVMLFRTAPIAGN